MRRLLNLFFYKITTQTDLDRKEMLIQFIKFGLVGLSNTLISWAIYYFFLWINEKLYLVGSIVGTIVSIANAFFWNDKFVFKGGNPSLNSKVKRLVKTYLSYGGTSLMSVVLIWVEVQLGISKLFAPVVTLIITIPLNFLINKFWTFNNR